jgi:hypothetical protein
MAQTSPWISDHVAPSVSPERAAVRIVKRSALDAGVSKAAIARMKAGTSAHGMAS